MLELANRCIQLGLMSCSLFAVEEFDTESEMGDDKSMISFQSQVSQKPESRQPTVLKNSMYMYSSI